MVKKNSQNPKKVYDRLRRKLALQAWKIFSIYVRTKNKDFQDRTPCFTCGRRFFWKELDAGHYRHTARKKGGLRTKQVDYDVRNINPQCTYCNRMLHGNLSRYSLALEELYGHGVLQELHGIYQEGKELTNDELKDVIRKYSTNV